MSLLVEDHELHIASGERQRVGRSLLDHEWDNYPSAARRSAASESTISIHRSLL